jgi:hypothetical protein
MPDREASIVGEAVLASGGGPTIAGVDATDARVMVVAGALVPPGWLAPSDISSRLPMLSRLGVHAEPVALPAEDRTLPRELAHDRWLRRRLDARTIAPGAMSAVRRLAPHGEAFGGWLVEPVHFHLGRDHVILLAGAARDLSPEHAHALMGAIEPLLAGESLAMTVLDPETWLLAGRSSDASLSLECASAEAAAGRNIEGYLPDGPDARRYRRLLNEIQMTWHEHPVNAEREARGSRAINGIWLSGPVSPPALAAWRAAQADGTARIDERLLEARLRDDRHDWLAALPAIEERLHADLSSQGASGILLCGDEESRWLRRGAGAGTLWPGAVARRLAGAVRSLLPRGGTSPSPASPRGRGAGAPADPLAAVFIESGIEAVPR